MLIILSPQSSQSEPCKYTHIWSFHSPPVVLLHSDHRLQASVPANLSALTLFHLLLTHFFMFLEFSKCVPILGPLCELFRAPGPFPPAGSFSCIFQLVCLLLSRAFFLTKPLGWLSSRLRSSPRYTFIRALITSRHLLVIYLTRLHGELCEITGPFVLLNTVSPECRKVARSLQVT